uniref:Uncharacterized protein n=1 Tax=Siphoviridae sp. ctZro7 TaxID=2825561 RepID=A0A8S5PRM3_9CAUD|nr:MAG TPA: hypothetical protein [Siphoviridae sp. ctZro7]
MRVGYSLNRLQRGGCSELYAKGHTKLRQSSSLSAVRKQGAPQRYR